MSGSEDSNSGHTVLQPGVSIKPKVSISTAEKLVQQHFGYQVSKIKELNSYDDNNFYIEGTNGDGNRGKFTFKVLNSLDSKKTGHIEAENGAMLFLTEKGMVCPIPQKNKLGATFSVVSIPNETNIKDKNTEDSIHVIRLLSFVEGKIMYEVPPTPRLLFQTGAYIAQIEMHFKNYSHPSLENHNTMWMISQFPELAKFTYVIKDQPERYQLVLDILDAFKSKVIPSYPNLEKGVLHGDFNEQNIIVHASSTNANEYDIHGLIDFGDMSLSYYVFEIAITLCYMMLECVKSGGMDPLVGSGYTLAGYSKFRKVPQIELDLLRVLISCRLCQSLVMGVYTYSQDPGNEYLLTTSKTGWELLHRVWRETSDKQLQTIWAETHLSE